MRIIRVLAAAAGACGLLAAPAVLASAQQETAAEVIEKLQNQGYTVRIDKIGTGPMDKCVVTSVRNPQQFTQLKPLLGGHQDGVLFPEVISQPVSVSLDCSAR
ncbi:hypothetical protein [Mycobacterium sp. E740]|uniref:hypothetical protein n=1 Tax=Mycobacterium sp. E740 TaxID=1834149 RepID=UPI0008001E01|nr:hypothetical protein [Mycobacterium sp. E740]OBI76230.1 hypothetical protein A5663_03445 [Mycobacterium sp. E740]